MFPFSLKAVVEIKQVQQLELSTPSLTVTMAYNKFIVLYIALFYAATTGTSAAPAEEAATCLTGGSDLPLGPHCGGLGIFSCCVPLGCHAGVSVSRKIEMKGQYTLRLTSKDGRPSC